MLDVVLFVSILAISVAWILWVHLGKHEVRRDTNDSPKIAIPNAVNSSAILSPTSLETSDPLYIKICYRDRIGEFTQRVIRPNGRFSTKGFDAWCEMRGENRTFLFDGIESATDLASGLSISVLDIYMKINPGSVPPLIIRAWKPWRVMQPLMMLVRDCSGSGIRDAERKLIREAGREALGDDVHESGDLDALLRLPTANINPGFFLPRLSKNEREICKKASIQLANSVPKKYSDGIRVISSDWFG